MAIIPDLPVLSFRVNWKEPIVERISFLSDVLRGSKGGEQRRSLRETPRRSFQADFLLTGNERTFWDVFMNKLGGGEMYVPIPWEVHILDRNLLPRRRRIKFDTTYREWQYCVGDLAILMGRSAFDYEIVRISKVCPFGVSFTESVERKWPVGSRLMPLRRAILTQIGDMTHKTTATATTTAEVQFNVPNPWVPAADTSPVYGDFPVLLDEPNWVEDLTVEGAHEIALLDTSIGRTYQVDKLGRALVGQAHRWFLPGRKKLAAFRDMIYRHRGRAGAFWLPTFKADFRLGFDAPANARQITVENVGFSYTGGPTSGREYIAIKHSTGTILRKVTGAIKLSQATERLSLDAPLGLALQKGLVRRISFADTARFDSDDFEISHYGGVDAHHDASTMFRSFKDTTYNLAPRATAWKYFVAKKTDPTMRYTLGYPDKNWAISNGPFGNTSEKVFFDVDDALWLRCFINEAVYSITFNVDDTAELWLNGVFLKLYGVGQNTHVFGKGSEGGLLAIRVLDTAFRYVHFDDDLPHDPDGSETVVVP